MMAARSRHHSRARGFTLLELLIALGIGLVGLAAAFVYARAQIQSFAGQGEVMRMQGSAEVVLDGLARDLRNAGMGTSFYAGVGTGSGFAPDAAVYVGGGPSGVSRGLPALRVANRAMATRVLPESDAVMLLRMSSDATATLEQIPCNPAPGTSYELVLDGRDRLSCLSSTDALLLVSDSTRPTGEPQAMILAVDGPATLGDRIQVKNGWGITPGDAARCTNNSTPKNGAAAGSLVVCIQPVSYWLDADRRLRLWEPVNGTDADSASFINGAVAYDDNRDRVLAEGVEDLQIAVKLSKHDSLPNPLEGAWLFAGTAADASYTDPGMLAEARVVRVNALMRTTRAIQNRNVGLAITQLEDHVLPTPDRKYVRRLIQFEAELRNLRLFDVLASSTRGWDELRSF